MRYVLNVAYVSLLLFLAPWWLYAMCRGKYREGHAEKLCGLVPRRAGQQRCVWMHAVSVGEVNLLQPLIERLPEALPGWVCVISTTTKTGYELAKQKYPGHPVFYCPLDFSWSVAAAMRRVRPDLLLLAELELWPNLIAAAVRHGARVAVANGRLSERSARGYGRIRWFVKRILRGVDLLAVQNEAYGQRFLDLGAKAESIAVTGSIKFDGAETDRGNRRTQGLARLAGITDQDQVFLAGSTQHPEEELALRVYRQLSAQYPTLRLLLIPRHPHRFDDVARMLDSAGVEWQRRSELGPPDEAGGPGDGSPPERPRVLLVDTVGELGAWWGAAHIAFVGGSMGSRGGQNMIEPAAYGAAVSFGPHTKNFRDVVRLLRAVEGAEVVDDGEQLRAFVQRCLRDPAWATQMGSRAQELVRLQQGATQRTLALLATVVGVRPPLEEGAGTGPPSPSSDGPSVHWGRAARQKKSA